MTSTTPRPTDYPPQPPPPISTEGFIILGSIGSTFLMTLLGVVVAVFCLRRNTVSTAEERMPILRNRIEEEETEVSEEVAEDSTEEKKDSGEVKEETPSKE